MMVADVKLAQALCSRLCHDLVGSVSAIGSGLELIAEDRSDIDGPLDLMSKSADQTARRLSFFRIAFGMAAGREGPASIEEVRQLSTDFFEGGRVRLGWRDSPDALADMTMPSVVTKILLNVLLLAAECLPRGGEVAIRIARLPEGFGLAIEAIGEGARIPDEASNALANEADSETVTPRNAHLHLARSLLASIAGTIETESEDAGTLRIAVLAPVSP